MMFLPPDWTDRQGWMAWTVYYPLACLLVLLYVILPGPDDRGPKPRS